MPPRLDQIEPGHPSYAGNAIHLSELLSSVYLAIIEMASSMIYTRCRQFHISLKNVYLFQ